MCTILNWKNLKKEVIFVSIPKEDIKLEKIVKLLEQNPEENNTLYDNIYNLYVLIGIAKGVNDMRNGRGMTLEEFNKEREALYESYNT